MPRNGSDRSHLLLLLKQPEPTGCLFKKKPNEFCQDVPVRSKGCLEGVWCGRGPGYPKELWLITRKARVRSPTAQRRGIQEGPRSLRHKGPVTGAGDKGRGAANTPESESELSASECLLPSSSSSPESPAKRCSEDAATHHRDARPTLWVPIPQGS